MSTMWMYYISRRQWHEAKPSKKRKGEKMAKVQEKIGNKENSVKLVGISEWQGGENNRIYLNIDNLPRQICKAYIDVNNNHTINNTEIESETDCGRVIIELTAGAVSRSKKDEAIQLMWALLDD